MRKVVHKWFWAWQSDEEERWLAEMSAKGLGLAAVGFARYEFEDCTPGEYIYRLELLDHVPHHPESIKYIEFIESTGAEQIGSFQRWVYFRRRAEDGPFELFSDNASRIRHLTRIITLILTLDLLNLYIGAYNIFLAVTLPSAANYAGLINIVLGLLFLPGVAKLWRKRRRLKREQQIFE